MTLRSVALLFRVKPYPFRAREAGTFQAVPSLVKYYHILSSLADLARTRTCNLTQTYACVHSIHLSYRPTIQGAGLSRLPRSTLAKGGYGGGISPTLKIGIVSPTCHTTHLFGIFQPRRQVSPIRGPDWIPADNSRFAVQPQLPAT